MFLITTVEHKLATAASDIVKAARFIEQHVVPALQKVQADAPTIEAITGLVSPQAVNIERIGFAVLGSVLKAIQDAGEAAGASGLSISLDAALVADIKAIAPAIQGAVVAQK
jgi:hypothetical protein